MTVKELKEILGRHDDNEDAELMIHLAMPSIGPIAMCGIKSGRFGFDWENGKFILEPQDRVSIKTVDEDVYHMSRELLMDLATSKSKSYVTRQAKEILLKAGYSEEKLNKYRHLFHGDEK
jgi:ABC-type oligopeptide transport system ATPase subunit